MLLDRTIACFFGLLLYPTLCLSGQVTVSKGDTIYSLLREQGISKNLGIYSLCTKNLSNIANEHILIVGQKLTIPSAGDQRCFSDTYRNKSQPLLVGKYRVKNMRVSDSVTLGNDNEKPDDGVVELSCTYKLPPEISEKIDLEGFSCGFTKSALLGRTSREKYISGNVVEAISALDYRMDRHKTLYHNLQDWMTKKRGKLKWSSEFDSLIETDVEFDQDFNSSIRKLSNYFSQYKFTFYEKNNVLEVIDN